MTKLLHMCLDLGAVLSNPWKLIGNLEEIDR